MSIYAIGMKGWVELREAATPPKEHTTKATVVNKTKDYWSGGRYGESWNRYDILNRKISIVTTVYSGGRVIKSVKARWFANRTKIHIRNGGILELNPELQAKVLGEVSDGH